MSLEIISAKLCGNPDTNFWSQVYIAEPEDNEIRKRRGTLFAIVSIYSKENIDLNEASTGAFGLGAKNWGAAKEIFAKLSSEYFKGSDDSLSSLKRSHKLARKNYSHFWDSLEIVSFSIVDGSCYLSASGGAMLKLLRDRTLTDLVDSQGDSILYASGKAKSGDIFVLGSRHFFNKFKPEQLKEVLLTYNVKSAVENLTPKVSYEINQAAMASLFLKVNELESRKVFEPPDRREKFLSKTNIKVPDLRNKLVGLVKAPFGKKLYLKETETEQSRKKRRVSVSVGIILIVLLGVSIFFGAKQARLSEYKKRYEQDLNEAEHELSEAESIFPISKSRSRELFMESKNKAEELAKNGVEDSRLDELMVKISEKQGEILGEYASVADLFLDLSLLSSGFNGDYITVSQEKVYVLDSENRKLVSILLDTKRSEVVAGPNQIDSAQGLAGYSDRIFILSDNGIYEFGDGKKKVIEKDWEGKALIHAYAGNLYLLDKVQSEIFRYSSTDTGFSSQKSWLAKETNIGLTDAKAWVIDGSIWVLDGEGNILRFSLGNKISFSLSGVYPEITKVDAVYTNDTLEYLYLLDTQNKRVVVVTKDGEYEAQYIADEVSGAKNLVVSEEQKKILLLTGEKLLSIDIKHLE